MSSKNILLALLFLFLLFPLVKAATAKEINIALYHLTPEQELCRCEAFNYNFIVYNTGSFNESYTFSVSKYTKSFNISPSTLIIEPNQTARVGIGARLPCSLTEPKIDFIAKTKATHLKAKTPLQLSINSSCIAPDINVTRAEVLPREVKALSALFIVLLFLVMVLLLIFVLQQIPKKEKEYWWSSYFRIPEIEIERRTTIIEIVTIVIVVIFLIIIGIRGFQQIGRNETLITTFMGPKNVTQPITNITAKPVFEKVGELVKACVNALCSFKQFLWPYKFYILICLVLLVLIISMLIMIIRRKRAKSEEVKRIRKIRWKYILIPLIIISLLALICASVFLIYKNFSKVKSFLSETITRFKLDKVKDFLLPKFKTIFSFAKDAFELVRPYLIYVVIGIALLAVIILILRRRERRAVKVVSVKEKGEKRIGKARKKVAKKKK